MSPQFLEVSINEDDLAELTLSAKVHSDWYKEKRFMSMRLNDYKQNPEYLAWGPRAILLDSTMIGFIGFHTSPNPDYLKDYTSSGIEMGYTIFADYRRCGYASEAFEGLIIWARQQGIKNFVLSISPDNQASLAMAKKFGFVKVGEQMDEEDGLEYVFVL
jgi:RimJ/RimL family protein N-acetyltransferase